MLYDRIVDLCDLEAIKPPSGNPSPAFFMFLAGLTSVADWIASNENFFGYTINHSVEEHPDYAEKQAKSALKELGWIGWQPPQKFTGIETIFPFITTMTIRPLQSEAVRLAQVLKNPGLVIIEAPMGEGKTEAAIYLADSWAKTLGQKGCYFALPTMATSNQMFSRVEEFIKKRYHDQEVNLMLLHGHAALNAEFESVRRGFREFAVDDIEEKEKSHDGAPANVVAAEWFTYRKRGLLAPFGVGTVDQVLLAILQTKHVFVRLFGLANKTIIIDEIHAYDAYMTTLLERLLEWLAALGASVVMLSATLPGARRNALLEAYAKGLDKTNREIPAKVNKTKYPRISWVHSDGFDTMSVETSDQSKKRIHLKWMDGELPKNEEEFTLGWHLRESLSEGGCAAIICNTVDRAQQMYQALKKYFPGTASDGYPELDLLHARFLYGDRQKREERVLQRFGKDNSHRPYRAVLVSTQIIEQSLDLDFDLMVTEMAPVDLLLQRAGRMHRHDNERYKLTTPTLWICQPKLESGVPCFGGGTEAVYDYHVLLRSWLTVKDKPVIHIPADMEELIEAVYGDGKCPDTLSRELREAWEESREKLKYKKAIYESRAEGNRIPPSRLDTEELLETFNRGLEEDNPEIHPALQALTRISEGPSVSVICLNGNLDSPRIMENVVDTQTCPTVDITKKLLERSVKISNKDIIPYIAKEENLIPSQWRKSAQLRHHYLLFLDDHNTSSVHRYNVLIDRELGLTFKRKEE